MNTPGHSSPISLLTVPARRAQVIRVAIVGAAVLLAVGLRWFQAQTSMVYDEMASLYFADRRWDELWGWWMVRETNPPLFYSLIKLWRVVVPYDAISLRMLPLLIALAHLWLLARMTGRWFGWQAQALAVLLFALSLGDIYQSPYLRAYGLVKLLALVAFVGLWRALSARDEAAARHGWLVYIGASVVAIYSHTTMVLWPIVAGLAVVIEAVLAARGVTKAPANAPGHARGAVIDTAQVGRMILANLVIALASFWVLAVAAVQIAHKSANISWLKPLSWDDFRCSANLQVLTGGTVSSLLMMVLIGAGAWRARRNPLVRMALWVLLGGLAVFKAADAVHPIISDFTLHWAESFAVIVAVAGFAENGAGPSPARRMLAGASFGAMVLALVIGGVFDLAVLDWMSKPQDLRMTVRAAASTPGSALLASHESMGVVLEQACRVEFAGHDCPFRLVVMADPAPTDAWAFGGYHGPLVPADKVRNALAGVSRVWVFSRYTYTPLEHLGLRARDYDEVQWDDGELVGPLALDDIANPTHRPAWDARYAAE